MSVTNEDWLQAQCSVLGSALIEPDLVAKVIAETTAKDYSGPCQTVYNAMRKLFLAGASVDVVSIAATLGAEYRNYLMQLMDVTPTAKNLDHYIQLCREQARILTVRGIGQRLTDAENSEKIRKLLEEANSLMLDKPSQKITTMSDALKSFMARHTVEAHYLSWPIRELNDRIYADLGDFIIFAGLPSTGKSAWALQCAWHWAEEYKVGFFSLETSSEKLFDRQMSGLAGISMDEIKRNTITAAGWDTVAAMSSEITSRSIELVRAAGFTPADVRAMTVMRGYQIVIIDYLQLLQGSGANRVEQVTGISMALHTMAQSMGVTVVALSQLKRKDNQSDNNSPEMSDLRESGQIEQDADVIMILKLKKKNDPEGPRELFIIKNKEGTCPKIVIDFDGKHQIFMKASRTGDVVGKYSHDGKKAQRKIREVDGHEQMSILPEDYKVPF